MEPRAGGGTTRRELIAGALGAAGADAPLTDPALLSAALSAEEVAMLAYRRVLALPALTAADRKLLRLLVRQDRQHAALLRRELAAIGQAPPAPPRTYADVDHALSAHGMRGGLATVRARKDAIHLLLEVEALCEGAYYTAVQNLSDAGAMVRAAQALASEAQHTTLLSELIYPEIEEAVPDWYVAGVR